MDDIKETYMSKKEEKITIGILISEIFLGLLALLTIFLPALTTSNVSLEGVYTTFGGGSNGGIVTRFFDFSFGNFLAYLLIIAGMILAFIRLAISKTDNLISKIITASLFLLGGILLIFCKQMLNMHINTDINIFTLSYGPLLGLIVCILDCIIVLIDIWFSYKISNIKESIEIDKDELKAEVMAEIEEEKRRNNKE